MEYALCLQYVMQSLYDDTHLIGNQYVIEKIYIPQKSTKGHLEHESRINKTLPRADVYSFCLRKKWFSGFDLKLQLSRPEFVWYHQLCIIDKIELCKYEILKIQRWLLEDRWENLRIFMFMPTKSQSTTDHPLITDLHRLDNRTLMIIARFLYF